MIESILHFLENFSPLLIFFIEYILAFLSIIFMARFFGEGGLFSYIALVVVVSNIQVLKTVEVGFTDFPIALGTILFSSSFMATDILTEFYGAESARKSVWIGFFAALFITIAMILTISITPSPSSYKVNLAMIEIFTPMPAIFFASIFAYLISSHLDIYIYQYIRALTKEKYLWLRAFLSTAISSLIDSSIFSILAWIVFAKSPINLEELVYTYILGTYIFRVIIIILQTPMIYFVRFLFNRG